MTAPSRTGRTGRTGLRAVVVGFVAVTVLVVLVFAARRFALDVPHLHAGTVPDDDFDRRYVESPWVAGVHITLGTVYLIGALHQLAWPLRQAYPWWHRRLGRVTATAGLGSAMLGTVLGLAMPYGGLPETAASVVFGPWMALCLVLGVRAIRSGDAATHRRWMIRAFAVGTAVGTIRLWVGALSGAGLVTMEDVFGLAFWLAFVLHVAAAEWWLRSPRLPR